jgi:endonuclease YncB( thermonuclease family)
MVPAFRAFSIRNTPPLLMRQIAIASAFLTICLAFPAYADFTGKVVAVSDGDTLTVLREHEQVKIRLAGIDAPEKAQAFGNRSKQRMSDMVFGKEVRVDDRKKDRYGRTIGRVWVASADCKASDCPKTLDAGLALLTMGLAWHYKQYAKEQPQEEQGQYAFAEEEARSKRVGLWREAEPVPPWEWRHR